MEAIQNVRRVLHRFLPFGLFVLAVLFCLLWAGRLVSENADERKQYEILNDGYSQILEVAPQEGLCQPFLWQGGRPLYGLRLNVAAFGRVNRGTAHLELYDQTGALAAAAHCDMTQLLDNTFYGFAFERPYRAPAVSEGGTEQLTLRFWYEPASEEDRLGLWASQGVAGPGALSAQAPEALDATLALQAMTNNTGGLVSSAYRWLAALVLTALAAGFLCLRGGVSIHRVFCLCGALLGLGFALVLPPLCGPDEYAHGAGAYALANRLCGQPDYSDEGELYMRACDAPYMTDETGPSGAFAYADWLRALGRHGQKNELTALARVRAPGAGSAYLYLPSAVGMLLARATGLGFYGLWLLGRLGGLASYLLLGRWALRRIPFGKTLLFVALLLPSTLGLAAAVSADTLLMGLAFALAALCLDCAFGKKRVDRGDIAAMVLLSALLGPGKAVYILLVGLIFLVPAGNYKSKRVCGAARCGALLAALTGWCLCNLEYIRYILRDVDERAVLAALLTALAAALAAPRLGRVLAARPARDKKRLALAALLLLPLLLAGGLYALHLGADLTPQQLLEGIQPNGDSIYTYSAGYSLRHLPAVAKLLLNTLIAQGPFLLWQVLGACPGEPIVHQLQLNGLLTLGLFCVAVLASLGQSGRPPRLPRRAAWWIGLLCLGVAALVTAACLTWTPVNYQVLFGLQGRYLLPILPLLLLLLGQNRWLTRKEGTGGALRLAALCFSGLALLNTLCLFTAL